VLLVLFSLCFLADSTNTNISSCNKKWLKEMLRIRIRMFLGLLDLYPDPLVAGVGSGSGSFYHQAKIERKTLISTVL
jgi:hypothetical protein